MDPSGGFRVTKTWATVKGLGFGPHVLGLAGIKVLGLCLGTGIRFKNNSNDSNNIQS